MRTNPVWYTSNDSQLTKSRHMSREGLNSNPTICITKHTLSGCEDTIEYLQLVLARTHVITHWNYDKHMLSNSLRMLNWTLKSSEHTRQYAYHIKQLKYTLTRQFAKIQITRKCGNYSDVLPLKATRRDSISNLTSFGACSNLSCKRTQCRFVQTRCGASR